MKFNEKLIKLRKARGMTQEDLAFQIGVSRQSVSKWEVGEFEPDISKIKEIAKTFEVSIDYLLSDEEETAPSATPTIRRVTKDEAKNFLETSKKNCTWLAFATSLCILSPVCLFMLGVMSEVPSFSISESLAGGVGMIVLLLLVTIAVVIFIVCDHRISPFSFLEKQTFDTEIGVKSMVNERKNAYKTAYLIQNSIGSSLCILSLIPLFIGIILDENNDLFIVTMLAIMFAIIAIGVFFLVRGGVIWGSFNKLLQKGEYTKEKK